MFSTYFGHHLSTIEGGLLCTNDSYLAQTARCVRNHGWDRDLPDAKRIQMRNKWNISEFNSLYTFYFHGFNVRSTDLQAFIGIDQLDKADEINIQREKNFLIYQNELANDYWMPIYRNDTFISSFAYPIIHPNRDKIAEQLRKNGVEVRPMICRSMGVQPFYVKLYGKQSLKNADTVDKFGMYIPNHPKITENEIKFIANIVKKHM